MKFSPTDFRITTLNALLFELRAGNVLRVRFVSQLEAPYYAVELLARHSRLTIAVDTCVFVEALNAGKLRPIARLDFAGAGESFEYGWQSLGLPGHGAGVQLWALRGFRLLPVRCAA